MAEKMILLFCIYPFLFIMYFLLKNECAPKKGYCFGVFLTGEQRKEPEVEQIIAGYYKEMRLLFVFLLLIPLPMLLIPWFSIFNAFYMVWLIGGIFAFFIPFARANGKLKTLKCEKGWKKDTGSQIITEISQAGKIRKVKAVQFVFPILLSLAAFAYALMGFHGENTEALAIAVGSIAFCTLLFYLAAVWMDRQKTDVISTDSEVNVNYTRAKKNLWKNLWVACAWMNTVYTIAMLFALNERMKFTGVFFGATAAYIILTLALVWMTVGKKRKLDALYEEKKDIIPPDEDDYWIWGMVYYNPHDKHSMVEKRHGTGTSVNMATPLGKGLAAFIGFSLLILPILCVWLILLEFTPIQLSVENGKLIASQIRVDYEIPAGIIKNVELLEELPHLEKVSGTGIDTLKKGTFRVAEQGKCQVFLNPENSLFLRFEMGGTTYYMSGYDDAETLRIYEELTQ